MTNVKTGWGQDDEDVAIAQGWYVGFAEASQLGLASAVRPYLIRQIGELFSSVNEATTHVMTQMPAGDALCYKAMRIVCKTNPAYESYKPMVREVRKKYDW